MWIALVRHLRPLIAPGICYGRLDVPPHPDAVAELPRLLAGLVGFAPTAVLTSPALRCRALAGAVAERQGLQAEPDDRLHELDFGLWEGKPWDSVPRAELDRWAAAPLTFRAPGGESGAELVARVSGFAARLLAEGRDVVVVSHGGPLRILPALLAGASADLLAPAPAFGAVQLIEAAGREAKTA